MKNSFEEFLIELGKSENTIKNYIGAFTFINRIANEIGLPSLEKWDFSNAEKYAGKIKENSIFLAQNNTGNNMYSASLNNFLKFMKNEFTVPQLPFKSFGWRWATTGIASHLNKPKSLKIVLDAILINGNGNDNYTIEFKTLIKKLAINKYSLSEQESDKLSKLSNPRVEKNIIENSSNYWYHLGLLETTGKHAKVSRLGEQFLNGSISNDEFILNRINHYTLPNNSYKAAEIKKWEAFNIKIHPFKIIQNIFLNLHKNYPKTEHYISEKDLVKIVIPCSYDLERFSIQNITNQIIKFRKNSNNYSSWPNPQASYIDDKGLRMANEFLYFLEVFEFLSSNKENTIRSDDKKYFSTDKLIKTKVDDDNKKSISVSLDQVYFKPSSFIEACTNSGLKFKSELITRYISSLATKPFVILSGLSGSGKTKLAQAFAQWICESEEQYCIVPVGADWINREPLLGYVNALEPEKYVLPENGALELIINANNEENQNKPFFLILDEMNLSHIERYFADFLSVMETKDEFKLHTSGSPLDGGNGIQVAKSYNWPKNLFVIGTVNIDETTYMFSPKVLDRANVIEFRIGEDEMSTYLENPVEITELNSEGASMAYNFVEISKDKTKTNPEELSKALNNFFIELQQVGAEFGYRTASEIQTLFSKIDAINPEFASPEKLDAKIDFAIMQKLLPKLHGSRSKLASVLKLLASLCYEIGEDGNPALSDEDKKEIFNPEYKISTNIIYPISLEKITRMYKNVIANGFTSYAEA